MSPMPPPRIPDTSSHSSSEEGSQQAPTIGSDRVLDKDLDMVHDRNCKVPNGWTFLTSKHPGCWGYSLGLFFCSGICKRRPGLSDAGTDAFSSLLDFEALRSLVRLLVAPPTPLFFFHRNSRKLCRKRMILPRNIQFFRCFLPGFSMMLCGQFPSNSPATAMWHCVETGSEVDLNGKLNHEEKKALLLRRR